MSRDSRLLAALGCVAMLVAADALASPAIPGIQTTDVTPFGFSVVWATSEPATPGIAIFEDASGTQEITSSFAVMPYPIRGGDPEASDEQAAQAADAALRE